MQVVPRTEEKKDTDTRFKAKEVFEGKCTAKHHSGLGEVVSGVCSGKGGKTHNGHAKNETNKHSIKSTKCPAPFSQKAESKHERIG